MTKLAVGLFLVLASLSSFGDSYDYYRQSRYGEAFTEIEREITYPKANLESLLNLAQKIFVHNKGVSKDQMQALHDKISSKADKALKERIKYDKAVVADWEQLSQMPSVQVDMALELLRKSPQNNAQKKSQLRFYQLMQEFKP